jgi:serine/threonine-protein kinase
MPHERHDLLEFGAYRIDVVQRVLLSGSDPIPLAPKVFDTLLALVESPGRVLEKEELLKKVWPDTFVEESSLARNVSTLRKVLGEGHEDQQFIETIPKRGYRFVAAVGRKSAEAAVPAGPNGRAIPGFSAIEEAASLTTPAGGLGATALGLRAPEAVAATRRRMFLATTAALVVGSAIAGTMVWLVMRPPPPRVARLAITATGTAALTIGPGQRDLVVTPDGTRVVYVGNRGTQLFVRPIEKLEATPIASAAPGPLHGVFASPDGQWIGFGENLATLKRVALTGGPAVTLGGVLDGILGGATWLPDDTIVFASDNPETGLQRLPAAGGAPTVLTRPDGARGELDHLWPERLPNGRAVLFTIMPKSGGLESAQVAVLDLMSGKQKTLVRGHHGHYVASGHLVYAAGGALWAVAFDVDRLAVRGTAVAVVPRMVTKVHGEADVAVAEDGTLVYVDAPAAPSVARTLVWVDRQGREEPLGAPPRIYDHPRVSPDGTCIVVRTIGQVVGQQVAGLWRWDLPRGPLAPLTLEQANALSPVWTPDGHWLVFGASTTYGDGTLNLFRRAADGTGATERLTESTRGQFPTGITPDGTQVVVGEGTAAGGEFLIHLGLLTLGSQRSSTVPAAAGRSPQDLEATRDGREHPHQVAPLLKKPFNESNGVISPDGRWLAYESNSSGQLEVYVRPFPSVDGLWLVSAGGGGAQPLWARNGRELFYVAPDGGLMVVPVEPRGGVWQTMPPTRLFEGNRYAVSVAGYPGHSYDVAPDGRFLMIKEGGADSDTAPPQIVLVQHFDEELKRLVPTR